MSRNAKIIDDALRALGAGEGLAADLAADLLFAADLEALDPGAPELQQARERLSFLAERTASGDLGAAEAIDALVAIDGKLAETGATRGPWAVALAPLFAERALHAAAERALQDRMRDLAERSPIVRLGDRTLVAAPVGPLGEDGLARFAERVAGAVLAHPTKRVLLSLAALDEAERAAPLWDELGRELKAYKVALERP